MKRVIKVAGIFWIAVAAGFAIPGDGGPESAVRVDSRDGIPVVAARTATLHVRVHKNGKAVKGLRPELFEASIGDEPMEIASLRELGGPTEGAMSAGRSLLVVLDLVWTPPPLIQQTVGSLRDQLDALTPDDRVALLVLGESSRLLHPFTTDREVLLAGLDLVDALAALDEPDIVGAFESLDARVRNDRSLPASKALGLYAAWALSRGGSPFAPTLPSHLVSPRPDRETAIASLDALKPTGSTATGRDSIDSLLSAFQLLSDVPGPKVALLFSRGLRRKRTPEADPRPPNLSRRPEAYAFLGASLSGRGWNVQAFTLGGGSSRRASDFDMSSSPVDTRPQLEQSTPRRRNDWGVETLRRVALETGGDHYARPGRLGAAIRDSLESTSHFYELRTRTNSPRSTFENSKEVEVTVKDLPRRAEVRTYHSADWTNPRSVVSRGPVSSARRQLLSGFGTRELDPAELEVTLRPEPAEPTSAYVLNLAATREAVATHLGLTNPSTELVLNGLALPSDSQYGLHPHFEDLLELRIAAQPEAGVEASGHLTIPCSGALVRLRLAAAGRTESIVLEKGIPATCSPTQPSRNPGTSQVRIELTLTDRGGD